MKTQKISAFEKAEIITLTRDGYSVQRIADMLGLPYQTVHYASGKATNTCEAPEMIKDEAKRLATIEELSNRRGKSYRERAWLDYLRGKTDRTRFISAWTAFSNY